MSYINKLTNNRHKRFFEAINSKYPSDKNTLAFIDAPNEYVATSLAKCAVEKGVNNGKVVAISRALAIITSSVIMSEEDKSLTVTT